MSKSNKQKNATRHDFLITFFDPPNKYSYKEINGYILVRQWNSSSDRWEVAIFTHESWDKKQSYLKRHKTGEQSSFLDTMTNDE